MTQEEHDRKILIERAAVEELLLKEHISVPAAYERVREYVDRFKKEPKLKIRTITKILESEKKIMENTMSELKEYLDRLGISTDGKTVEEVMSEIASVWNKLAEDKEEI